MFFPLSIHFHIGLMLGLSLATTPIWASTELEGLIRDGVSSGISIKSQRISFEQSQLAKTNTWTNLLPTLSLSAGQTATASETLSSGTISKDSTQTKTAEISGSWSIWDNYSNIRNIQIASINETTEKLKTDREVESFVLSLIDNYFDYLLNLRRKEVLTQQLDQARWTHQESLTLVQAGARTEIESLDTEIQVLNSERDLMELNQTIKSNIRNLQVLLNKDENYELPKLNIIELQPYFMKKFPSALASLKEKSATQILNESKDFQISKLGLEANLQRLKQTELGYWPTTSLRVSHSYNLDNMVQDIPAGGARLGVNSTSVSLNLSWQFWDWWSTPRSILSSQLDYQNSLLRFTEETKSNRAKIEAYLEDYDVTVKSVEASEKALDKAIKQLDYAREMYRLGRLNLLMMQQATSRLYDAQNSYASRKKALYVNAAKLMYYQGETLVP